MQPNEVGPRAGHHSRHEGTDNTYSTPATTTATGGVQCSGTGRPSAQDTRPWRRRRQASYRCEPLLSGQRDPWQPGRPETLSRQQVDGAVAAARHLRDAGLEPMFDLETLRAMWTAGHHQLVDDLRGGGR